MANQPASAYAEKMLHSAVRIFGTFQFLFKRRQCMLLKTFMYTPVLFIPSITDGFHVGFFFRKMLHGMGP
jgi:hypothetical protein